MLYDFDRIPDRRALRALKWMDVPQDVIAMSVADMEFPLAQRFERPLPRRLKPVILAMWACRKLITKLSSTGFSGAAARRSPASS